jgi:hypothetical protein
MDRAFAAVHAAAGLDLKQLYPYFGGFRIVPWSTDEGLAGNPVHWLLGVVGLAIALVTWRRLRREHRAVAIALATSLLLFAMTVRWQPFNGRLHMPFFVLLAPCLALMLNRLRGWRMAAIVATLSVGALPSLLANTSRPIVAWSTLARASVLSAPREEQYFPNRPYLYRPYVALTRQITATGCRRIGLFADYDAWEYPLWALGRSGGLTFVHQVGAMTPPGDAPCAWVGLEPPPEWRPPASLHLTWHEGLLSLWR